MSYYRNFRQTFCLTLLVVIGLAPQPGMAADGTPVWSVSAFASATVVPLDGEAVFPVITFPTLEAGCRILCDSGESAIL